jgi:hypothetical protein
VRRSRRSIPGIVLFACVLVGCGISTDDTVTVKERTVTREAPTTTTTAPKTQPATPTTPDAFTSPTGNIVCQVTAQEARCGLLEYNFDPPPRPSSCTLPGWGHTVGVGTSGAGGFICAGDPPASLDEPPLAYGRFVVVGPFACASFRAGVRCANRDTRHGFTVARGGVQVY